MGKWKTVNLEQRQYALLKELSEKEGKSLGSKIGEAVDAYLASGSENDIDLIKLSAAVRWTNYRVALIHRWLELTIDQKVIQQAKRELDNKRSKS